MIHGKWAKTCETTSLLLRCHFVLATRQSCLPEADRGDFGAKPVTTYWVR